ncbi:MAG: leucine-rich repeat protein [Ruminococcus sp.]|uniref:leucine-rich repeat domain-containing protein n=1 Tax=Ruminococcus sp. TaxID=41978 RepID=UPI0025EA8D89|nr:leucine-rich repeat domain-containing protein [Ruminococcus sp.]MCR5540852.1 leucine-rich repeat protein [Ruminococcus sp.]
MKSKKIISGLLALSFIFGGTVLPNAVVDSTVISASAEKYGLLYYEELDDGTVKITNFYNYSTETDVVIPSEINGKAVIAIGVDAFCGYTITSITIPDTVYSIGADAFYGCSNLQKVDMSKNIKNIGSYAFAHCHSLESITLPEGLQSIDESAFYDCDSLKSIEIPASLMNIGEYAFSNCDKLENVTFAERTYSLNIDKCAFWECKSLKELDLPDKIIHIGEYAFSNCDSLKRLSLSGDSYFDEDIFSMNPNLESVTISSGIDTISTHEFSGCKNLKEITIPASVTYIGANSFSGCIDLVIKCYKDTAAHKYAIDNDIKY